MSLAIVKEYFAFSKERTIRSETTKSFMIVFLILLSVSVFTVTASVMGSRTFDSMKDLYLKQLEAVNVMQSKAKDIVGIFYLLSGDIDLDIQMENMTRYDSLRADFNSSVQSFRQHVQRAQGANQTLYDAGLAKVETMFGELNANCQEIVVASMEGRKEDAKRHFKNLYPRIDIFEKEVAALQTAVAMELEREVNHAQFLLKSTIMAGLSLGLISLFISLVLIYNLMKFLSISLLPISNLMDNMRQSVFSIDRSYKVKAPVSKYSNVVFAEEIVGLDVMDVIFKDFDKKSPEFSLLRTSFISSFGADDLQWMLVEDALPRTVHRVVNGVSKILHVTYTPLWDANGLLQDIMIVVEDITEVEKLKQEALRSENRSAVVQRLIQIEKADFLDFESNSQRLFDEAEGLIRSTQSDPESRRQLFRILHTLKGNSHLFKFDSLVASLHHTEGQLQSLTEGTCSELELHQMQQDFFKAQQEFLRIRLWARPVFKSDDKAFSIVFDRMLAGLALICEPVSTYPAVSMSQYFDLLARSPSEVIHQELLALLNTLDLSDVEIPLQSGQLARTDRMRIQLRLLDVLDSFDLSSLEELPEASLLFVEAYFKSIASYGPARDLYAAAVRYRQHYAASLLCSGDEVISDVLHTRLLNHVAVLLAMQSSRRIVGSTRDQLEVILTRNSQLHEGQSDQILSHIDRTSSYGRAVEAYLIAVRKQGNLIARCLNGLDLPSYTSDLFAVGMPFQNFNLLLLETRLAQNVSQDIKNLGRQRFKKRFEDAAESLVGLLELSLAAKVLTGESSAPGESSRSLLVPVSEQEMKVLGRFLEGMTDNKELVTACEAIYLESVKHICSRMRSLVLDLGRELRKPVSFLVRGDDIRVPRDKVPIVRDILTHLLRNAMDHGIEPIEERKSTPKPLLATIEIECRQFADRMEIRLQDDGAGINQDRVARKAIQLGRISESETQRLSPQERVNLIFLAGLSTKENVTNLSGRGVGMDAVKSAVEKELGGGIEIFSESGRRTEVVITLPASAARYKATLVS